MVLGSPLQIQMALDKNKSYMGRRYVEVFRAKKLVRAFHARNNTHILLSMLILCCWPVETEQHCRPCPPFPGVAVSCAQIINVA